MSDRPPRRPNMDWITSFLQWANSHEVILWWLFAASLALLLLTPVIVVYVVVQLPADYFTQTQKRRAEWTDKYPALRPIVLIAKNLFGMVLMLTGIVMLLTPGQGLLTLIAGLMLVNFPGKLRLERWLVTRRHVWRSINWLRRRAGRKPLERPK